MKALDEKCKLLREEKATLSNEGLLSLTFTLETCLSFNSSMLHNGSQIYCSVYVLLIIFFGSRTDLISLVGVV